MITVETLVVGQLQTNCYIVWDQQSKEAVVIDPGDEGAFIAETLLRLHVQPTAIYCTHGHFDHILAAFDIQQIFNIPCLINEKDYFLVERMHSTAAHYLSYEVKEPPPVIDDSLIMPKSFFIGDSEFIVLETPGHTPGGISVYSSQASMCFTGDTIFADGAIGDWSHSYSKKEDILSSISVILRLPASTILYPGHGKETTVEEELMRKGQ